MSDLSSMRALINLALQEDIGAGDLTAFSVPPEVRARADLVAKEEIVVSGLEVATLVLEVFGADASVEVATGVKDGSRLKKGAKLLTLVGRSRDLLTTERTILNILQRLCGVATLAAAYKEILGPSSVKLLDTRKTTPGMRAWEKKAVRDGGLFNHRARLDEAVLIKENHIRASGSIALAVSNLHGKIPPETPVEIEVTNWEEAQEAIRCGIKHLLLDNFTPLDLAAVVAKIRAKSAGVVLEASGGITRENLRDYAASGVDTISMGALTHSVRAVDLSLLFQFETA